MGIMQKKMETTIQGLGFSDWGYVGLMENRMGTTVWVQLLVVFDDFRAVKCSGFRV